MKRALKFLLVFVVAATGIFTLVIGTNYSAFKTLFENNDGMRDGYEYIESTYSLKALTEFIGDHPKYMSVVSFNIENPDSGIYYQADTPRTLGTLANFFLILEYERQVEAGLVNPSETVDDINEIERFVLPEISGEAHRKAQELLDVKTGVPIVLDTLVSVLAETNDLAIADFLWFKLGGDNIQMLMDSLNLENTDTPLPFSGLYLSIHPEISDTSKIISRDEVIDLAGTINLDDDYVSQVKQLFNENRLSLSFIEERDALEHFPHTTPREIAMVMSKLYKNELLSPAISEKVKEKMKWAFKGSAINRSFSDYGAMYDNRMGMLSGIDFGTSIYDGHTSAQAVFFDKLPVAFWLHLSSNHMQEDYQQRLIWDPALYETTKQEITNN